MTYDEIQAQPEWILRHVAWTFAGKCYESRAEFEDDVTQESLELSNLGATELEPWIPEQIVLRASVVRIAYDYWDDDEIAQSELLLHADNGESFTAAEILYKINNAVVDQLRDHDHQFFEGLWFGETNQEPGQTPLYYMVLGS